MAWMSQLIQLFRGGGVDAEGAWVLTKHTRISNPQEVNWTSSQRGQVESMSQVE